MTEHSQRGIGRHETHRKTAHITVAIQAQVDKMSASSSIRMPLIRCGFHKVLRLAIHA
jgi:hypothetical protein